MRWHRRQWLPALAWVAMALLGAAAVAAGLGERSTVAADLMGLGVVLACGGISVEAARRIGEVDYVQGRVYKDLLAVWVFVAALLLPPVYALAAPLPLCVGRRPTAS